MELAAVLLAAFARLLRFTGLIQLTFADILFSPGRDSVILILRDTKSGHRANKVEKVVLEEPLVAKALRWAMEGRSASSERVYTKSGREFREEFRRLGALLGMPLERLTPYSLRRGGATWHFQCLGSLALTTAHGRWADERTARIYIDGALAQLGEWQAGRGSQDILHMAARAAVTALRAHRSPCS